jgi:hypothetical protein
MGHNRATITIQVIKGINHAITALDYNLIAYTKGAHAAHRQGFLPTAAGQAESEG